MSKLHNKLVTAPTKICLQTGPVQWTRVIVKRGVQFQPDVISGINVGIADFARQKQIGDVDTIENALVGEATIVGGVEFLQEAVHMLDHCRAIHDQTAPPPEPKSVPQACKSTHVVERPQCLEQACRQRRARLS